MQIRWIAEDWHELTTRIRSDENLQHRAEILKLIDTDSDPDRRERTIRELYPQDYQYLKESVYPHCVL